MSAKGKPAPAPSSAPANGPVDDGVFQAFNRIVNLARDLNTQLATPEVVVYGKQGHGKSSLIETLIGHPITLIAQEKGAGTKRPIFIHVVNNIQCEQPRITLKRDSATKNPNANADIAGAPVEEVEREIQKRNIISSQPIHIQYEYKYAWNMTLIDTPGLLVNEKAAAEVSPEEIEEMVIDLAKPGNRILLCVEEVKDGSQPEMLALAKKVDPKLDRTIFVFTKFSDQLKNFTSTRDLNKYLSSTISSESQQSFFVTLVNSRDRKPFFGDKAGYKKKLEQLVNDDMNALEQLQYDRRYANSIGALSLRRQVVELTWSKYQANIPELLKRLRAYKKRSEDNLQNIQKALTGLDSNKLRGNASRYVMQFLQCVQKLLSGTLEGNPAINGQTLEEEKSQDETGDWLNHEYAPVKVSPAEWKIPYYNSKLYGGQQFERLLAEFKAVADHISVAKLTMDDIATAAGPQKLNNAANATWAASDIVQRQIQRALLPLIDQLFKRATYIMRRLVTIVENMMEQNRKTTKRRGGDDSLLDELDQYPFFTHAVKDLYFKFVDQTATECKKKCRDEFFSTRIIYWELTNLSGKGNKFAKIDHKNKDNIQKVVSDIVDEMFVDIRDRIAKNILLKSYNFFLVPMQSDLWSEIQGNITALSDDEFIELFEVDAAKARMEDEAQDMRQILSKFTEQENLFMEYAGAFSRASQREFDL